MDIINFFQELATHAHYRIEPANLINGLSLEIQNAFLKNDVTQLKMVINQTDFNADKTQVVYID